MWTNDNQIIAKIYSFRCKNHRNYYFSILVSDSWDMPFTIIANSVLYLRKSYHLFGFHAATNDYLLFLLLFISFYFYIYIFFYLTFCYCLILYLFQVTFFVCSFLSDSRISVLTLSFNLVCSCHDMCVYLSVSSLFLFVAVFVSMFVYICIFCWTSSSSSVYSFCFHTHDFIWNYCRCCCCCCCCWSFFVCCLRFLCSFSSLVGYCPLFANN